MTEPTREPTYFLVRTTPDLVERGLVGVGWSEFRFDQIGDAETAIQAIIDKWGSVRRWGNQIRRFYGVGEGDCVVAPLPYAVAIGTATGGLIFDEASVPVDRANQRKVTFPRDSDGRVITIPRTSFSEAFQRRLRVQGMTVNDLGEFSDEIEEARASLLSGADYTWQNQVLAQLSRQQDAFKRNLLANIQEGRTNLQTGGVGLENLVRELLEAEGYKARVLSKRQFGSFADADVQASRADRCASVKLLVQVKHHQGFSNEQGIRQLEEIRKAHAGEYDDHNVVFVTSASVSEELRKAAELANVTVLAGLDLADWISDQIDRLSPKSKLALGIYEVPAVIKPAIE
jgi:restriction system protein